MNISRSYNDAYYVIRKKILEDFKKDEEQETIEYLESIENIVSSTKLVLKSVVIGDIDYKALNDKLIFIEKDLMLDCESLTQTIYSLYMSQKITENSSADLQKYEDNNTGLYFVKLENLKKELEQKEFKIQNMEKLYLNLENIIKENIKKNSEQLLSLNQFNDFICQNDILEEEVDLLEIERKCLLDDYNILLMDNVNLKSKNESFELEKIKDALEEISVIGQLHIDSQLKIKDLQSRFNELTKECICLTDRNCYLTKSLESLNVDNTGLNQELGEFKQEVICGNLCTNKSFCGNYHREDDSLFVNNVSTNESVRSNKTRANWRSTFV